VKGDRITYKDNPNYWNKGYPKVEKLVFRFIPESATRVAALQNDEVDIITRLSAEEADSLRNVPGVKVIQYQVPRIYYIAFDNISSGIGTPIENPLVRQAMNYAVDVDGILKALFAGNGKRAAGFVASSELGYGVVPPFPYDPAKAKELLAEAGYPDGFSTSMACPSGVFAAFQEVCSAIVSYLGDVGIQVELEMMESGHFRDLMVKKELPPMAGDSWADESGEAYNRLAGALGGKAAGYSLYSDPEIDKILAQISSELDRNKRKALYEQLQIYMQQNPPFIYLYEPVTFEATRDRVFDYKPRPSEMLYLFPTGVNP
jgi:peptide/nickel transport system substrate-binding protein